MRPAGSGGSLPGGNRLPFPGPAPRRGKRNEPAWVAAVAARVAELRGESLEEVARTSTANAARLFGLTLHNV